MNWKCEMMMDDDGMNYFLHSFIQWHSEGSRITQTNFALTF